MKQIIRWAALLLAGALIFTFAACKTGDDPDNKSSTSSTDGGAWFTDPTQAPTEQPVMNDPNAWRLTIRGANISEFTSNDAKFQTVIQNLPMTVTDPNYATTLTHQYTGITLKSILSFVGVPDYRVQSVTVTSANGKVVNYSAALALDEGTLLAWEEDGSPIKGNPPLKMCPKSGTLDNYVEMCTSIDIVTLAPGQTLPNTPIETLPNGEPLQPTLPGNTTRNRWTLGTTDYPTFYVPTESSRRTTTRPTSARPSTTRPTTPVVTTQPTSSGTTRPTASTATTATTGTTTSGSSTTTQTTTSGTTKSTKYSFTTRPTTTKPTTTAPTTSATTTTARTTHTFPFKDWGPEEKSRYDRENGLPPNYPPDY